MRYLTAGESHGSQLTAIIEGVPAGLMLSIEKINQELARRQGGYGRGGRMKIEQDQVEITSGVRHGKTLGSPITMTVKNKDWKNWQTVMSISPVSEKEASLRRVAKPRPGHADLVGGMKYQHRDLRNVLERSSARETTMRVAIGALAKQLLSSLAIEVAGHVAVLGGIKAKIPPKLSVAAIKEKTAISAVNMVDLTVEDQVKTLIDTTKKVGDTLGGIVEVRVENVPAGLGSYVQWDKKLDGKLAQAMLSINAFKGVEFGIGFEAASLLGSEVMDEIIWNKKGYQRKSNHLGGFEGGMTNGEPLIIRGVMKPIPTLYKPLMSVNIDTKEPYKASVERSDITAVPAASVVAEHVIATTIAMELLDYFPADNMQELKKAVENHRKMIRSF
ncbi:chorismate synthase [Enterococcus ratti]|uniref:Chorismate synthase n=1 Tax=Enterococcus ratti TaxID=150033 RepID=A0A1L8WIE4_9ENTE|nr:chorismate synthase [Enterococcus ratti]OJG80790.1 chorismate synthase [Enterococcus ratti]